MFYGNFTHIDREITRTGQLLVTGGVGTGPLAHEIAIGAFVRRGEQTDGLTSAGTDGASSFACYRTALALLPPGLPHARND